MTFLLRLIPKTRYFVYKSLMNNPIALMSLGAFLIALSPIVTKAVSLGPSAIGFYRFFFGTISIAFILLIKRPKLSRRDKSDLKSALPYLVLSGIFFSIDLFVWNRSILSVGSGVATLLANTQVFYIAIIGKFLFKDKFKSYFHLAVIIAFIGIYLTSFPFLNFDSVTNSMAGILYGLATGLSYAFVTFSLRKANDHFKGDPRVIVFGMTFFAAIFSLIITLSEGSLTMIRGMDLLYMFFYGSIIHFVGWLSISKAIKVLPIALASLLLLLQPALATILGHLVYAETLSKIQASGLIISLVGIYMAMRART